MPCSEGGVEDLNENPSYVTAHPLVKNLNEEVSVLDTAYGAAGQSAALLEAGLIVTLDDGNELDITGSLRRDFIAQEAVDLQAIRRIGSVDAGERIEFYLMLMQQLSSAHHGWEHRFAALILAVGIVQPFGAVDAETYKKSVFVEERAPLVIKQRAVGLEGIMNGHSRKAVFLLVFNRISKKGKPHQGRFAALPTKCDFGDVLGLDVLAGKFLEQFIAHAELRSRIQPLFFQVKTVLAVEVTD